jgi:hypothetical protein
MLRQEKSEKTFEFGWFLSGKRVSAAWLPVGSFRCEESFLPLGEIGAARAGFQKIHRIAVHFRLLCRDRLNRLKWEAFSLGS